MSNDTAYQHVRLPDDRAYYQNRLAKVIAERDEAITVADHHAAWRSVAEKQVERLRAALSEIVEHAEDMNSYDAGRVAREALEIGSR